MLVNRFIYTQLSKETSLWDHFSFKMTKQKLELKPSESISENSSLLLTHARSSTRAKEAFRDKIEADPKRVEARKKVEDEARTQRKERVYPLFKFLSAWGPWEILYWLSALFLVAGPPVVLDGWLNRQWLTIPLFLIAGHHLLSIVVSFLLVAYGRALPSEMIEPMLTSFPAVPAILLQSMLGVHYGSAWDDLPALLFTSVTASSIVVTFALAGLRAISSYLPFLIPFWAIIVPLYLAVPINCILILVSAKGDGLVRTAVLLFFVHFIPSSPFAFFSAFATDGLFGLSSSDALVALHLFAGSIPAIAILFFLLFIFNANPVGSTLRKGSALVYVVIMLLIAVVVGVFDILLYFLLQRGIGYWTTTWIPLFLPCLAALGGWILISLRHPNPWSFRRDRQY